MIVLNGNSVNDDVELVFLKMSCWSFLYTY